MGLFTLLARHFSPRKKQSFLARLAAAPLSPRRLERRRVLDASVVSAVLTPLGDGSEFVQVGGNPEAPTQPALALNGEQKNTPPDNLQIVPLADVFENDVAQLAFTFDDPDFLDSHTVEINWGDGTPIETINLSGGERFVFTTHQYLDDNPTNTSMDVNQVMITVTDSQGDSVSGSAPINVFNVAPVIDSLSVTPMLNENDTAELQLTFTDPGSLDTHTVEIDWGDGTTPEIINLTGGERFVSTTHKYLDDNPTGTPFDVNQVKVTITDDDMGVGMASETVLVKNVAPIVTLDPVAMINENGSATLSGSISDVGTLDTFTLEIDWGDPLSPNDMQSFMLGTTTLTEAADGINWDPTTRMFSLSHQYLDDNPTMTLSDTYTIGVTATDDDTGVDMASETVLVKNVAPMVTLNPVAMINENDFAMLSGQISDVGTLDTFSLEIDWGDPFSPPVMQTFSLGTTVLTEAADGINWDPTTRMFSLSHQYLDDNPSGTDMDIYTISVKVTDDDTDMATAKTTVTVKNVNLTVMLDPVDMIEENGSAVLMGTISDVGTLDTFSLEIDWGDPLSPNNTQSFMLGTTALTEAADGINWDPTTSIFSLPHQYLDDNPTMTLSDTYTISVSVTGDDLSSDSAMTTVLVKNVAPELTFDPLAMIDENGTAFLSGTISDPGTLDTFTIEVDWDDPLSPNNMQSFALGTVALTEAADGINWDPTTRMFSLSHQYLDDNPSGTTNDTYTIRVKAADDDTGEGLGEASVLVKNVDSIVSLDAVASVIESGVAFLTGSFTDVGTLDTHTATVSWGDGTISPASIVELNGSGTLSASHQYLDNDGDNVYTIAVTVFDDDGGAGVMAVPVVVFNVNPSFVDVDPMGPNVIIATDVNNKGQTTLTLQFIDPGVEAAFLPAGLDAFQVLVDWGDKLGEPDLNARFVVVDRLSAIPLGPLSYVHQYTGPPDPLHPAADIVIRVKFRDDDFYTVVPLGAVGESVIAQVVITNPGIGAKPFRIDTTPQVPRLEFARETQSEFFVIASNSAEAGLQGADVRVASSDSKATTERVLVLRVVDSYEVESEGIRLKANALKRLPRLFANLPDNHYKIYLIRIETSTERLVIEVYVRNGKFIDRSDDSEGTRDRPPTDEATGDHEQQLQDESQPGPNVSANMQEVLRALEVEMTPNSEILVEPVNEILVDPVDGGARLDTPFGGLMPVAAGLVATRCFGSWAEQVDRAVAEAGPKKWRELRQRSRNKRKNR